MNHFIEVGYDEQDYIWVIVHSGSRGLGHSVASHYMKLASPNGKASDGVYALSTESQEGKDYIKDLNFCLEFALENRVQICKRVVKAIKHCGIAEKDVEITAPFINRNHNHAELKDGLWIHRKGATHAEKDMLGVIPGNMRDGSFIVRGKGNPNSLCSSSHGAGRVLGRKKAKEILHLEDFERTMVDVVARVNKDTLDESPFAYKDIYEVMKLQEDLVEVIAHVKPLINIKG